MTIKTCGNIILKIQETRKTITTTTKYISEGLQSKE